MLPTTPTGLRAEDILESLTRVIDPGYGINIVDLGIVYGVEVNHGVTTIQMTMTSPDTPHKQAIVSSIHQVLRRRHAALDEVLIDIVSEPEWRPDFVTEAGLMQMRHPVRPGASASGVELSAEAVRDSLKLVLDPEVGINIVDLGLIYNIVVKGLAVHVEMTLTTPGCPLHATIEQAVRRVLDTRHPDIADVQLELVWEPAWDVDKITPEGRAEFGMVNKMTRDPRLPEPILASWKISEVLKHYPQLLDVLVDLSPAFGKLRNPVMRRVQTRLVTVQQAAGIAGLDPAYLVRTLNKAAGITPPDDADASGMTASTMSSRERPAWRDAAPVVRELDVRAMLEKGQEPFRLITGTAREVQEGEVLRLVANFEPLPLYDALARQGFSHWAESMENGDWQVWFHRDRPLGQTSVPGASTRVEWDAPATSEVTIDVSELVPPEPMMKILQELETLPEGARLLVHHVRRPMHLYDRLDEMGYAHETRELASDRVQVLIQKPASKP